MPRVRFGEFELDENSGELWKDGARQVVAEQPFAFLRALLARPGDLVGRDELRQRLWPAETFVDFEHGLNAAVKKLRDVLGDSADSPRFIETIPRRGYRFIARVKPLSPDAAQPARSSGDSGTEPHRRARSPPLGTGPQALALGSNADPFWRRKASNLIGILVALAACLGAVAIRGMLCDRASHLRSTSPASRLNYHPATPLFDATINHQSPWHRTARASCTQHGGTKNVSYFCDRWISRP